jgi:hypothetical protein
MAVRDDFAPGEVLAAADLNDTFGSKVDYATPTNAQTGTTYTFVAADANRLTTANNGSAVTFEIPPESSVTWGAATILRVVNYGAGALTVAGGSGVTVTNTATVINQYGGGAAIRTGSDEWTFVPFGAGSPNVPSSVEYLVIAGGGGAGYGQSAGGGAGGYRSSVSGESSGANSSAESAFSITKSTTYTVTIGGGGAASTVFTSPGTSGSNSVFSTITSTGGGGGGSQQSQQGANGGSGGGSSREASGTQAGGTGTASQGSNGGSGTSDAVNYRNGGGGGGASQAGANATSGSSGVGGNGLASSIAGSSVTRAGGGGGNQQLGGTGASQTVGGSGPANTGSGGNANSTSGGAGGSGVVIIRYPDTFFDAASTTGSPSLTTSGGYKIYTFTGSGSITW